MSKKFNKYVQELLNKKGFALDASGKDSKEFRAAIRDAQLRAGLRVTETVTEETLDFLRSEDALPAQSAMPVPRTRAEGLGAQVKKASAVVPGAGARGAFASGQLIEVEGLSPAHVTDTMAATMLAPDASRQHYVVGDPSGLIEDGNINLDERRKVANADGSFSSVLSKSFEEDGMEVLIPTIDDEGKVLDDEEAWARYRTLGEHLGKFFSAEDATNYSQNLSSAMAYKDSGLIDPEFAFDPSGASVGTNFTDERLAGTRTIRSRPTPNERLDAKEKAVTPKARQVAKESLGQGLRVRENMRSLEGVKVIMDAVGAIATVGKTQPGGTARK